MTEKLGDYELGSEIGRGGMGRVFRARHVPTGAERALKLLEGGDAESVRRFRREAEALARVGPTVAVAVHEAGFDRGRAFFVMDLMAGGSLASRLEASNARSWKDAVALAAKLARAVARCHAVGLVHRDLKPANVLFTRAADQGDDGEPRLADFGCVRDLGASKLTATGTSMGTPGYMAPEQIDGERGDERADVYALAVILHELVAGARPHEASRWHELLLQAKRGLPQPIAANAKAPAALDDVLRRGLAFEASRRPSAAELADELEGLLSGKLASGKSRSARVAVALVAVTLIVGLALAGGAIYLERDRPAPAPNASPSTSPAPSARPPVALDVLERRLRSGVVDSPQELTAVASRPGGSDLLHKLAQDAVVLPLETVQRACSQSSSSDLRSLEAVAVLASSRDVVARSEATKTLSAPTLRGHFAGELALATTRLRVLAASAAEIHLDTHSETDLPDPTALANALAPLKHRPELVVAATLEIEGACRADLLCRFDRTRLRPLAPLLVEARVLEELLGRIPHAVALEYLVFRHSVDAERLWIVDAVEPEARAFVEAGDELLAGDAYSFAFSRCYFGEPRFEACKLGAEEFLAKVIRDERAADRPFARRSLHDVERWCSSRILGELRASSGEESDRLLRAAVPVAEGAYLRGRELLEEPGRILFSPTASAEDAHRFAALLLALDQPDRVRGIDLDSRDLLVHLRVSTPSVGDIELALEKTHPDSADRATIALVEAIRIQLARIRRRDEEAKKLEAACQDDTDHYLALAVVEHRLPVGSR